MKEVEGMETVLEVDGVQTVVEVKGRGQWWMYCLDRYSIVKFIVNYVLCNGLVLASQLSNLKDMQLP